MNNLEEQLNMAAQSLLESEVRLSAIKAQLDGLDRELALLIHYEYGLEENIRWLKRKKVVTVASEYKKSVESLRIARSRMSFFRIDKSNILKLYKNAETVRDKAKLHHEYILILMEKARNNVIYVNFGKQDGQE